MNGFRKNKLLLRMVCFYAVLSFAANAIFPSGLRAAEITLPNPAQFVNLSSAYSFPVLKGLKFDPQNPIEMEFVIDTADQKNISREEAAKLVRYFLAGLTIPAKDIWVNMSPYEKDKIIPAVLAETDLGKDLLGQDYILKQISSSLTYPESDIGKDFWIKTYGAVAEVAHTAKIPVNTFNKIWIVPDEAAVYEGANMAIVTKAKLKTMLDEDYLALSNNVSGIQQKKKNMQEDLIEKINKVSSAVMREVILPKINREVNSGRNFAALRQIYHSLILAIWFKQKFQDSLYQYYINQGKIKGIDLTDKDAKEKIYNLYVEAFKKGIYNYIRAEKEFVVSGSRIKRQYFSGGISNFGNLRVANSPIADVVGIDSGDMALKVKVFPSNDLLSGVASPLAATQKPHIYGNWKFRPFKDEEEARKKAREFRDGLSHIGTQAKIVLYVEDKWVKAVSEELKDSNIHVGVQSSHFNPEGNIEQQIEDAFNWGAQYAMLGHSMDRYPDPKVRPGVARLTNEGANKIAKAILKDGRLKLHYIIAVDEDTKKTLAQNEDYIKRQIFDAINTGLEGVTKEQVADIVMTVEPLWDISTKTGDGTIDASTKVNFPKVEMLLKYLNEALISKFGQAAAEAVNTGYGASAAPDTSDALLSYPGISNILPGGKSLEIRDFRPLVENGIRGFLRKQQKEGIIISPDKLSKVEDLLRGVVGKHKLELKEVKVYQLKEGGGGQVTPSIGSLWDVRVKEPGAREDNRVTLDNLFEQPGVSSLLPLSVAQALGSTPWKGGGEAEGRVIIADTNAVYMTHLSLLNPTQNDSTTVYVVAGDEGSKDKSASLPVGRVYWKGYEGTGYKDFGKEDGSVNVAALREEVRRLRGQNLSVWFFVGDALELTKGLVDPDALKKPTNSWSVGAFLFGDPSLVDDISRIGGWAFNAPSDAGVTPFDLPSEAFPKMAQAKGITPGSAEYASFMNKVIIATLGPRKIKKETESKTTHRHQEIIDNAKRLQQQYPGLKIFLPGDGDLMPRLLSIAGLELDGYTMYAFGRGGANELTVAALAANLIKGGQFPHSLVSERSTNSGYNAETAYGYLPEEEQRFQGLGITKEEYSKPRTPQQAVKGKGIIALTAVTGAAEENFGKQLSGLLKGVDFVRTDAKTKAGEVRANTFMIAEDGSIFVVCSKFSTPDVEQSYLSLAGASPEAGAYLQKGKETAPVKASEEVTLSYNRDAQTKYSGDVIKEGEKVREAFVTLVQNALGNFKEPLSLTTQTTVASNNYPEAPVEKIGKDGKKRIVMPGNTNSMHFPQISPENKGDVVISVDGLNAKVALQHISLVLPSQITDPQQFIKKMSRNFAKVANLDVREAGGMNQVYLEDGDIGIIDVKSIRVQNIETPDFKGAIVEANIWYEREAVVKNYKTSVPDSAIEGLPVSDESAQQPTAYRAPLHSSPEAKNVAVFGARGRVGLIAIKQSLLYNAAHPEAPVEVVLAIGTTPKDLIEGIQNDSVHGRFLNFKRGDKIISGKDSQGRDFIQITFKGRVQTIYVVGKVDMAGFSYLDYGGIDLVVDATEGKTEEELRQHIRAGAKRVINTAPGKAGPDGKVFPAIIMGVNDSDFRFHKDGKKADIRSMASCTTNSVANILDSLKYKGGRQADGARERWRKVLEQVGSLSPNEKQEARLRIVAVNVDSDHAVTLSNLILDKNVNKETKEGGPGALNNALIKSSGLSKALKELFPDINDPENSIKADAVRLLINDMSVSGTKVILYDESGEGLTEEKILERIKYSLTLPHKAGLFGIADNIRDSSQGLGLALQGILMTQSLRLTKLSDNTYEVNFLSLYDNEWGFTAGNVWNSVLAALEDPIIPEAKEVKELLENIDPNVIAYNEAEKSFRIAEGAESKLRQPEGMLEYLAREASQNPNEVIRQAAQDIINDISAQLNVVSYSKDEFERLSNADDRLGETMRGAPYNIGYGSGFTLESARAIIRAALKGGVVPVINIDTPPVKYSTPPDPLHQNEIPPVPRKPKETEAFEPDYAGKIQSIILAAAVLEGYVGIIALRESISVDPKNFEYSKGTVGNIADPLKAATEDTKSRIREAAENGIYNFGIELSALVNKDALELARDSLKNIKQASGLKDEDFLRALLKTVPNEVDAQAVSKLKKLIALVYAETFKFAKDLTVYTRQLEQEIGHRSGPMSVEFELSYNDEIANILGGIWLQEQLSGVALADVAKPNRIIFRGTPEWANTILSKVSKEMFKAHTAAGGYLLDFIGLSGLESKDAAVLARKVQTEAMGRIFRKATLEPENERLQQLVSYMYDLWRWLPLAHKDITEKSYEKVEQLGMEKSKISARYRGIITGSPKIFAEAKKNNWSLLETFALIFSEDFSKLPKGTLTADEIKAITSLNNAVVFAFSSELWDLHRDEGREAVEEFFESRQPAMSSNRAVVEEILKKRQTQEVKPDPLYLDYYRRLGYEIASSAITLPKATIRKTRSQSLQETLENWIPHLGKGDIQPIKPYAANMRELWGSFSDIVTAKFDRDKNLIGIELKEGKDTLKGNSRVWDLARELYNPDPLLAETASWMVRAITNARGARITSDAQHYNDLKEGKIQDKEHYVNVAENMRSGGLLQAIAFYQTLIEMNAYGIAELARTEKDYSGLKENWHFIGIVELAAAFTGYDGPIIIQADHRQIKSEDYFALDEAKVKERRDNVLLWKNRWKTMTHQAKEVSELVDMSRRRKAIEKYQAEIDDFLKRGGHHIDLDISTLVDNAELTNLHEDTKKQAKENPGAETRWIKSLMREIRLKAKAGAARQEIEMFLNGRGINIEGVPAHLSIKDNLEELIRVYTSLISQRYPRENVKGLAPLTNEIEIRRARGESMKEISDWLKTYYTGKELREWVDLSRVERYKKIHAVTARETVQRIIATQTKEMELKRDGLMDLEIIPVVGFEEKHTDDPLHVDNPTEIEGIIALYEMIEAGLREHNETFRRQWGVDLRMPQKAAWNSGASHGVAGREINTTMYLIAMEILGIPGVQHGTSKATLEQFPGLRDNHVAEAHLATQLQNDVLAQLVRDPRVASLVWDMLLFFMGPEDSNITLRLRSYLQLTGQRSDEFLAYAKANAKTSEKFAKPDKKGVIPWEYYLKVLKEKQGLTPQTKGGLAAIVRKMVEDGDDVPEEIRSSLKDLVKYLNAPLYWYMQVAPEEIKERAMSATRSWREKSFGALGVRNNLTKFSGMPVNPTPLFPLSPEAQKLMETYLETDIAPAIASSGIASPPDYLSMPDVIGKQPLSPMVVAQPPAEELSPEVQLTGAGESVFSNSSDPGSDVGGIDMNDIRVEVTTSASSALNISPSNINFINIEGLTFKILEMQPVLTSPVFGIFGKQADESEAKHLAYNIR